jgi:hypothetical protein
MNAVIHSKISVRRRGGKIEDYLPIHSFIDSTKELCSDNRHRILHNLWGIRRVIIPIFGNTIINSDGKEVNVKDLCEQDHILPDYQNRFIPTLSDFVEAINDRDSILEPRLDIFLENYKHEKKLKDLLLSPLSNTGMKVSLIITHNSWFINEIVPKILNREPEIKNFDIKPSEIFNNMDFELWMDNGSAIPRSAIKTVGKIVE